MSSTGVEMKVDMVFFNFYINVKEGHGYDFEKQSSQFFVVLTKFGSCFCLNF